MCLGVPGKVLGRDEQNRDLGRVEFNGIKRQVNLSLVPDATPGDYVIVHAGFAISLLEESEAQATIAMFESHHEASHEIY